MGGGYGEARRGTWETREIVATTERSSNKVRQTITPLIHSYSTRASSLPPRYARARSLSATLSLVLSLSDLFLLPELRVHVSIRRRPGELGRGYDTDEQVAKKGTPGGRLYLR